MDVTVQQTDWVALFGALGTFITVVLVPSVLLIIRELRKNKDAAREGRLAIVEETRKNTEAVRTNTKVTEGVLRETAGLRAVATGQVDTTDPRYRAIIAKAIEDARARGDLDE